jgi:hypothetical protein
MPFIDVFFTKINVERERKIEEKLSINSSLNIKEPEKDFEDKERIFLTFPFTFSITYGKNAKIIFEGHVLFVDEKKKVNEILKNWKNDKDFKKTLYNYTLTKCNIKAFFIEDLTKLPFHLPLPKIKD